MMFMGVKVKKSWRLAMVPWNEKRSPCDIGRLAYRWDKVKMLAKCDTVEKMDDPACISTAWVLWNLHGCSDAQRKKVRILIHKITSWNTHKQNETP
jgi:hypothetical protein